MAEIIWADPNGLSQFLQRNVLVMVLPDIFLGFCEDGRMLNIPVLVNTFEKLIKGFHQEMVEGLLRIVI